MRKTIGLAFMAAACAVLAACAQPAPVQPLPPGPTPDEVADYARAQAQYSSALASGNGDVVAQATNTFSLIANEIFCRQDPSLFDARLVCERYRVSGPRDGRGLRSTYETQFVQDCQRVAGRYNQERPPSGGTWKRGSRRPTARTSLKPGWGTVRGWKDRSRRAKAQRAGRGLLP